MGVLFCCWGRLVTLSLGCCLREQTALALRSGLLALLGHVRDVDWADGFEVRDGWSSEVLGLVLGPLL